MKQFEATEIAYKNGYEKGRAEAIEEFLKRSKELSFYTKTNDRVVDTYSLERIAKEMDKGRK